MGAMQPMSRSAHTTHLDIADYARAERFLPWNVEKLIWNTRITPHWIDASDCFWYRRTTQDGTEFIRVDPGLPARQPAFDHEQLATALSKAFGTPIAPYQLPFDHFAYIADGQLLHINVQDGRWLCDLSTYVCHRDEHDRLAPFEVWSPNDQLAVFVQNANLYLRPRASSTCRQLTTDGAAAWAYATPLQSPLIQAGLADSDQSSAIALLWSPDSTKFITCRIDQRGAEQLHLVQSIVSPEQSRPMLHSYAYSLPGDLNVPMAELRIFDVEQHTHYPTTLAPIPVLYYGSPLTPDKVWWSRDSTRVYVLWADRGFQGYTLSVINAQTGQADVLIREQAPTGIEPRLASAYGTRPNVQLMGDGHEIVWFSQRSGWGHLYLYDGTTGQLKQQITSGEWVVTQIAHIDEERRFIYVMGAGRESGHDPYELYLYRVHLDGSEPELLTPEPATHGVVFSPSGRYFVDTHSRVDMPSISVLATAEGTVVCELERANIDGLLATGWRTPTRFRAVSRDGTTPIYGVMIHPSTWDPSDAESIRKYPVLDNIYGGPQINQAPVAFPDFSHNDFWQAQALAELGFIIVMIDGLGMPGRAKAFHDYSYRHLSDGGIADHIAAIQTLATQYRELDIGRVGVYGHSAGGYAAARALLAYPDFYHVAVASAGNHNHRLDKAVWVERYMGLPVGAHYDTQANKILVHQLTGKLLLVHGDMDENVHIASTLELVYHLIEANKDFDFIVLPNRTHGCHRDPYFIRQRWNYFVQHLLQATPPQAYRIQASPQRT